MATAAAFTNLCQHTLRLRNESDELRQKVEGLHAAVEEREDELLSAGEKIVILQKVVRKCDSGQLGQGGAVAVEGDDKWEPLMEKIEQAARASRTKDVLMATTAPFGSRNASCMTEAVGTAPACGHCSDVRTEVADVAHTIAKFDLADEHVGVAACGGEHQSPFECNERVVDYLGSHRDRLEKLVAYVETCKAERAAAIATQEATQVQLEATKQELKETQAELASTRVRRAALRCIASRRGRPHAHARSAALFAACGRHGTRQARKRGS